MGTTVAPSCSTTPRDEQRSTPRPALVIPTFYSHLTATLITLFVLTAPVPFVTVQI